MPATKVLPTKIRHFMADISPFERDLNESQLEAVTYCDGPSLVIAGAGSGKTRVLTYKIAYLLQNGLEPWNILALTFTNKAAREMNERISALCGEGYTRYLWSGTFHSLFARMLRAEHERTGYPSDFTIYDAADSKSLIKTIVKEMQLDDKVYKPNTVAGRISEAKNHLMLPGAYGADSSIMRRDHVDGLQMVHKIYETYQQRLRAAGAMDFDDLLLNTFLLLRDHEEVRRKYMDRFRYILVDEYQDTNMAQHRILSLLTTPESRICVVGDDAQSIYGFRGADISNILQFKERYPSARVIKLECNYRSTQYIVDAANSIIAHNRSQIPKKVFSAGDKGEKIQVFSAMTDKEEATKVAARVIKLHRNGVDYNDIALLYRTNAQSRSFEETFRTTSIPYRIYGGLSFYQRKEIKDVMAYLRLVCNPHDEEAFRRIINYPARGIGATTIKKVQLAAAQHGVSLWQVAIRPEEAGLNVNAGAKGKLQKFCSLIEGFRAKLQEENAYDLCVSIVRDSGIGADLTADRSAENISRQENVNEFLGSVSTFVKEQTEANNTAVSLADFLPTVALLTDADQRSDDTPRVTLMTVHASKGLEFDSVFVTGMEDELFPNSNAKLYPKEMEEERRLFYVAVTRAKRHCFLSYAKTRFRFGTLDVSEVSPFIDEVDENCVEREVDKTLNALPKRKPAFSSYDDDAYGSYESKYQKGGYVPSWQKGRNSGSMRDEEFSGSAGYRASRYDQPVRTPRRVAPPTVPPGFKRTSVTMKNGSEPAAGGASNAADNALYPVGTRIEHERFGKGTIQGCEGAGENMKLSVAFDMAGTKKLLVKFAKFRVL